MSTARKLFTQFVGGMAALVKAIEAKSVRDCDCLIWKGGYVNKGATPVLYIPGTGNVSLRKLIVETRAGKPMPNGIRSGSKCRVNGCVKPAHVVAQSRSEVMKIVNAETGYINQPARRQKIAGAMRARSTLDPEAIRVIRESEELPQALADRYGKSRTLIRKIQCGDVWRETSGNPFAGLL